MKGEIVQAKNVGTNFEIDAGKCFKSGNKFEMKKKLSRVSMRSTGENGYPQKVIKTYPNIILLEILAKCKNGVETFGEGAPYVDRLIGNYCIPAFAKAAGNRMHRSQEIQFDDLMNSFQELSLV